MPCAWLTGLHQTIAGTQFGGIGPGLSPRQALSLGLKVDQDAIPPALILELKRERLNLDDPAVTLELLRHNAVLGLTGFFGSQGKLQSVGIQCAVCHSTQFPIENRRDVKEELSKEDWEAINRWRVWFINDLEEHYKYFNYP